MKKKTEWSNKDYKYKRNLNDFQELCKSCHYLRKEKMSGRRQKVKCACGKEFETYIYPNANPYEYMCNDCHKNEWWRYATRMLKLEKFRCVKCSWKLTKKDSFQCDENILWFKCKCCGLRFGLYFPDPADDYYEY